MYKYNPQCFHASLIKNGLLYNNNVYQSNLLLRSYIKSQSFIEAHKLLHLLPHPNLVSYNTILSGFFKSSLLLSQALNFFDSIPQKNCQSWNIVISGFAQHQRLQQALTHFIKMRRFSIKPDNYTYSIVLPCCDFESGKQVHAEVVKVFNLSDEFLGTNLLRMYSGLGEMDSAKKVFDEMRMRDLVTWNALIFCYSKCGMGHVGVELFRQMGIEGVNVGDQPKLNWQPHGRVANPHGKRKAKEVGMSWQAMRLELAAMRLAMRQQQRRTPKIATSFDPFHKNASLFD
ncbi:pentatricopeptide repeat-containing protein At2g13600-like [Camellia sinensis]|uniref:pentatricopeptide repeat-containing protein At2g13600-like n=1 Tax=Camellia sinensis TaxID=4442 RepID=UPI00103553DE|nr:pentatricopeptide repeat-containing protein At2g13600-like [Camellia sinensis]